MLTKEKLYDRYVTEQANVFYGRLLFFSIRLQLAKFAFSLHAGKTCELTKDQIFLVLSLCLLWLFP